MIPLSVLDLSPVLQGTAGGQSLRNSIDLARLCDELGYQRYWLAEHHNAGSVVCPAPDIMVGQIAAVTNSIRVGAGGVMLRNHAPFLVAERYKLLEALFPGRIDLGIGRAPGTDPVTSSALRRWLIISDDDFTERLQELTSLETRTFPQGHPLEAVHATPPGMPLPPIWLLGSTAHSAEAAAAVGSGFAFAHHFSNYDAVAAMSNYRNRFRPTGCLERPRAILTVHVVCAGSDEEAEYLAKTVDLNFVRSSRREFVPLSSPREALVFDYTPLELDRIQASRRRLFVGAPETIAKRLTPLIAATKADEVMIQSMIYDHGARRRSYELMAKLFRTS